jgi:hypothetical protein
MSGLWSVCLANHLEGMEQSAGKRNLYSSAAIQDPKFNLPPP